MTAQTEDKWQNAREQAQAQFESIREMVEELRRQQEGDDETGEIDDGALDEARDRIQEDALSVEVRSDWVAPGAFAFESRDRATPAEYRILLCTGGPAVQITGTLSEHGEPETARLEMQDWFLPWTEYRPLAPRDANGEVNCVADAEEILLAYARQFYFGE